MAFNNREYAKPGALSDWLSDFAEEELKRTANPLEDIRSIFNKTIILISYIVWNIDIK